MMHDPAGACQVLSGREVAFLKNTLTQPERFRNVALDLNKGA